MDGATQTKLPVFSPDMCAADMEKMIKNAELTEAGTSMTLGDAEKLTSTDVRFPTSPQTAAEKLYGWSVVVDSFHGEGHDIANAVRDFVLAVGPALTRLHSTFMDGGAAGMDLVCRVLFEAQQEYFNYVTIQGNTGRGVVPTFGDIKSKVLTYRAESLSSLPSYWYSLIDAPTNKKRQTAPTSTSRQRAGAQPSFNAHADSVLLTRFRDAGHPTITAMMEGKDVEIPKHGDKEVCLAWCLKGACNPGCKRKDAHVRYSQATVRKIHSFLDECGVGSNPN